MTFKLLFKRALQAHQSGNNEEARLLYQQLLKLNPEHLDSMNNLGLLYQLEQNFVQAEDYFKQALSLKEDYIDALFNLGTLYQHQSQFNQAIQYYEKTLTYLPTHSHSLLNMGIIAEAFQQDLPAACHYYQKALNSNPEWVIAHCKLANIWRKLNQLEKAEEQYLKAVALSPQAFDIFEALAKLAYQRGQKVQSIQYYLEAIKLQPARAEYYNNLGVIYTELEDFEKATQAYSYALTLCEDSAPIYCNLGNLYSKQNDWQKAKINYKKSLQLNPEYSLAHQGLGNANKMLDNDLQALEHYQTSLTLTPNSQETLINLGSLCLKIEDYNQAEYYFQKAHNLNPNHLSINQGLGTVYLKKNQSHLALKHFLICLELSPESEEYCSNIGSIYLYQGLTDMAYQYFERAYQLNPQHTAIFSNLLFCFRTLVTFSEKTFFKLASQWSKQIKIRPEQSIKVKGSGKTPLKIGYLSPDFCKHSAATVFQLLFQFHNRNNFKIYSYAHLNYQDKLTEQFKSLSDVWREITHLTDDEVFKQIQRDQIDILVDLSGHTAHNRLKVFALRPAPIQVTGLGYGCTTGLNHIDYRFSDIYATTPFLTKYQSEKVFYLKSYLRWTVPEERLPLSPLPVLRNGHITFGSNNALFKLNRCVIKVWANILLQLPRAQLWLKDVQFDEVHNQQLIIDLFESFNISSKRLIFQGKTSMREHLLFNQQIDIALDPFPYNGGITTLETLWMGVPVLTLKGGSRSGQSILSVLKLNELVAQYPEKYIQKAIELASDIDRLKNWRQSLRNRLEQSVICNGQLFAREVEQAYRMMFLQLLKKSN